ncbi:MAG TPA: hypothetical protein VHI98_20435 [Vicinamibacterales bacterium]|jgi:hypothetical protein|nr:hypothetical protein [Vicinamibacterales bacterium]
MSEHCRHLTVDRPVDRTLWLVIETFVREGFRLKALDVSRRPRQTDGRSQDRYFLIKATYPDVIARRLRLESDAAVLIACDELAGNRTRLTLTTVTTWREPHPALIAIEDALEGRVTGLLDGFCRSSAQRVAA